jgi:hypothetical protein
MRIFTMVLLAALAAGPAASRAQDAFDACEKFTLADAESVLGRGASPEPQNPKVKRPKVVTTCSYYGSKDGQVTSATAQFRFAKSEADVQKAFDEERLKFQTKPMIIAGGRAFWSAKQGQLHVQKGRAWLTVAVGSQKPAEREPEPARRLAEQLAKKL